MGGGVLPKFAESVMCMTLLKVLAETFEVKTHGMKFPLLSSAKTAAFGDPCVRLTLVIRCLVPMGGVHLPVILFADRGLIVLNVRWTFSRLMTCSCSTRPTDVPTTPSVMKSSWV